MTLRFMAIIGTLLLFPALALSQVMMLNGTVEKVGKDRIVLKTDTGHETIELSSNTKGADQTKVGDKVTINATKKGEKLVASSINTSNDSLPKASPSGGPSSRSSDPPISPSGMENRPPAGVR